MDATTSGTPTIQYHNIPDQSGTAIAAASIPTFPRQVRHCFGDSSPGEFPLAANPSIVLHATCSFFRRPANFTPDYELSISELAALDICQKRAIFKPMTDEECQNLKRKCGGSWKLALRFLLAGEACCRREKSQAIAGPAHSIAVTSTGVVYSFGSNTSGQLGHGTMEEEWRPQQIRSLQGIRIIQAAAGAGRTMLVSDAGRVYAFGKDSFGEAEFGVQGTKLVATPQLIESLRDIFELQEMDLQSNQCIINLYLQTIYFVSSQWSLQHVLNQPVRKRHLPLCQLWSWPQSAKHDYNTVPVSHSCFMSVYSVGCGLGGKLGHGSRMDEKHPRLIEQFRLLNLQPMVVATGAWHAAVVARDGSVCTWGWGRYGCLGHGNEECESVPKVVEALIKVKAVHVATGDYTTFVLSEDGDVYSFGCGESASLGHNTAAEGQGNRHANVLSPELVKSLKQVKEKVVQISQISLTNSIHWNAHTFALTESGKLYAFGAGDKGQLGVELMNNQTERVNPERVDIDLE
ncbi:hypothetical protein GOBAR_DD03562 [Gossypium barbadense]|nr:hypothetical protein GOBAR_DD03562 [Gossypium barbadense]